MRFSKQEMQEALNEISQNEKPLMAIVGALIGAVPAIAMYYYFSKMGGVLSVMLAIPPFIVGIFSRFMGCTYRFKHRVPAGIVGAIVHVIGCLLLGFNPLVYLLTPVAFAIDLITAKIKLAAVHEWAIDQKNFGILDKEPPSESD